MDATTQAPPAKLARTTSAMSTSSEGSSSFVNESGAGQVYRRTRTRFTHQQLSMLERLYARTSHPTREDRDALARAAGMETKHITIWFQNKRQNERKMALQGGKPLTVTSAQPLPGAPRHLLYNNTLASPYHPLPPSSLSAHSSAHSTPHSTASTHPYAGAVTKRARTRSHPTHPAPYLKLTPTPLAQTRTHPSLDHIASRAELRSPPHAAHSASRSPHPHSHSHSHSSSNTNTNGSSSAFNSALDARAHAHTHAAHSGSHSGSHSNSSSSTSASSTPRKGAAGANLWDAMPTSPPSPFVRRETEFEARGGARRTKTLEWACASARMGAPHRRGAKVERHSHARRAGRGGGGGMDVDVDADADADGNENRNGDGDGGDGDSDATDETVEAHEAVTPSSSVSSVPDVGKGAVGMEDEDMMAAYVLCGLGRTR